METLNLVARSMYDFVRVFTDSLLLALFRDSNLGHPAPTSVRWMGILRDCDDEIDRIHDRRKMRNVLHVPLVKTTAPGGTQIALSRNV